jgi:hypothetical protein
MDDGMKGTIGKLVIITDHRTTDRGFVPGVLLIKLSDGEVKFAVQPGDQWLETTPFFFEGSTTMELELKSQNTDCHCVSSIIYTYG